MKYRTLCLVVMTLMLVGVACSSSHRGSGPPASAASPAHGMTLLTIGSSATEGDGVDDRLHDAWPYLVYDETLPSSGALVNAALDDATAAHALTDQAPVAAELHPDVVAIWLGADDIRAGTPVPAFVANLTALIATIKHAGAGRILVADVPNVYGALAAMYDAAIRSVTRTTSVELVELADANITLVPTDGLPPQPDAASHRVVADAFERALRIKH